LKAILWAAFIAAQCVWGFSFGFFESGAKTFLADKVRFASRAIFKEILYRICFAQKIKKNFYAFSML